MGDRRSASAGQHPPPALVFLVEDDAAVGEGFTVTHLEIVGDDVVVQIELPLPAGRVVELRVGATDDGMRLRAPVADVHAVWDSGRDVGFAHRLPLLDWVQRDLLAGYLRGPP